MKEKLLLSLANTVCLNSCRAEDNGFVLGRLGISLFLYHFARYKGEPLYDTYSDLADTLIDSFWDRLNKNIPLDFDSGLSGVTFGIDYLINNEFLEGDGKKCFIAKTKARKKL